MRSTHFRFAGLAALLALSATGAEAITADITVTNIAPAGGVAITPVWVGFHNGSFDSYDGGSPSAPELERLAEDGDTGPISGVFAANGTLVATGTVQTGMRWQATLGGGPLLPGASASTTADLDLADANRYFSYASMVLPSNDYYIANGNPLAHDISSLLSTGGTLSFLIGLPGTVNDAGTEVNDFATSAGNPLFPGLPPGQGGPNIGADEGGVNANVANPFAGFANVPGGFDLTPFDFNAYPSAIARVDISVSEPGALGLVLAAAGAGMLVRRRRG